MAVVLNFYSKFMTVLRAMKKEYADREFLPV
jgi:hypothetical protein